jgi:ketopantoate reductase
MGARLALASHNVALLDQGPHLDAILLRTLVLEMEANAISSAMPSPPTLPKRSAPATS